MIFEHKTRGIALKTIALAGVSSLVMTTSMPAIAQTANRASAGAAEEIIVSARKREESIMKTPVVIQALPAKQIEDMRITNVQQLNTVIPGAFLNNAYVGVGTTTYLRGVGNAGSATYLDQSVGLSVDGFSANSGQLYRQGIFDAAQIEVLKGPQALFFGKSTTGGLIAITSADPTPDWEASATVGYEFASDEISVKGHVAGPITDKLGLRVAGFHSDSKGWMYNPTSATTRTRVPAERSHGGRLTLKYDDPDIGLRIKLKLSHSEHRVDSAYFALLNRICATPFTPQPAIPFDNCQLDLNGYGSPDSRPYLASGNFSRTNIGIWNTNRPDPLIRDGKPYGIGKMTLAVLNADYDFMEGLTLTSVTSLMYNLAVESGIATSSIGLSDTASNPKTNEYSQELRLTSDWKDSWINFMIGGLYDSTRKHDTQVLVYGNNDVLIPNNATIAGAFSRIYTGNYGNFKSKTKSVFGQLLLTPIEHWELSAGVRYNHIHKYWSSLVNVSNLGFSGEAIGTIPANLINFKESKTTPEFTLTYRPTDDLTAFVSYKHGYKGPGWNSPLALRGITAVSKATRPSVRGETAKGVEGGIKAVLMNRQLALTASGYLYNYKDLQVAFYNPVLNSAILANGANARIQGFEVGADYTPDSVPGLKLSAFVNYNDTHYSSFPSAPCYSAQTVAQGCNLIPGTTTRAQNMTGRTAFMAPKWVGNIGANYRWDLNDSYAASIDAQVAYSSKYIAEATLSPFATQKAYALLHMSAHLMSSNDTWDLSVSCRNCTNKLYIVNSADGGYAVPSSLVNLARPRQVMVQLTVRPSIF